MLSVKSMVGGLMRRTIKRASKPEEPIHLAPASAAIKLSSDPIPGALVPDAATPEKPKATSTGDHLAVLTLGDSGEILSARGDCPVVFGWEGTALPGQNIRAFLEDGLENDVGRFLEGRRKGENIVETILLRVVVFSRNGTKFLASVTSPTWSPSTKPANGAVSSPFGWTLAFRASPCPDGHRDPVPPAPSSAAATQVGSSERAPVSANGAPAPNKPERLAELHALNSQVRAHQPSPPASSAALPDESTSLRQFRLQIEGQLAAEQQTGAELRRKAEEFEKRLAEAQAELSRLQAERQGSDSEWRQQLDLVTQAWTNKLETTAKERDKRFEDALAGFYLEREEFKGKLATAQFAVDQSVQRQQDLDNQLRVAKRDFESARSAGASARAQEAGRGEFELRAQFEASQEAVGFTEAALKEERLCREKLEQRLQTLTCQSQEQMREQAQQHQRLLGEFSALQEQRDDLQRQLAAHHDALAAERETSAQARKQADAWQTRLDRNATELARVQAELDRQKAGREQAQTDWRQQWASATGRQEELELARADALSRCAGLQEKLTQLRQEHAELKGRLADDEQTAIESRQTQDRLEDQLRRVTANLQSLEAAKADADNHAAEVQAQHGRTQAALEAQLKTETAAAAQAREQAEDLQRRLDTTRATLEQAQADLSRLSTEHARSESQRCAELEDAKAEVMEQKAARERAESQWREQLENARTQREDLEAAWGDAMERNLLAEEELAKLRQSHDQLLSQCATEQQATIASERQADELQSRLKWNTAELERAKLALQKQQEELKRSESESNERLKTAKDMARKLQAAWNSALERNKCLEAELAALRQERDQLDARLSAELSSGREAKKRAETLADQLSQTTTELNRSQRLPAAQPQPSPQPSARPSARPPQPRAAQSTPRPRTLFSVLPTRTPTSAPTRQSSPKNDRFSVPLLGTESYDLRP